MNFKDWKTTVPAIVSALCSFVAFCGIAYPTIHIPQVVVAFSGFSAAGGLAVFGINATSGSKL